MDEKDFFLKRVYLVNEVDSKETLLLFKLHESGHYFETDGLGRTKSYKVDHHSIIPLPHPIQIYDSKNLSLVKIASNFSRFVVYSSISELVGLVAELKIRGTLDKDDEGAIALAQWELPQPLELRGQYPVVLQAYLIPTPKPLVKERGTGKGNQILDQSVLQVRV